MNLSVETRWECPACGLQDMTRDGPPVPGSTAQRFHPCPKLGIVAPMVAAGTVCKIETHEREDYVGSDLVRCDSAGRPVMSVTVTREDGEDCVVFAPTVRGKVG